MLKRMLDSSDADIDEEFDEIKCTVSVDKNKCINLIGVWTVFIGFGGEL